MLEYYYVWVQLSMQILGTLVLAQVRLLSFHKYLYIISQFYVQAAFVIIFVNSCDHGISVVGHYDYC